MAGEFGRQVWSGAVREAFLRGLASHGSVRRACRETGMAPSGAYDVRRRDRDFAGLWDTALARVFGERQARAAAAAERRARDTAMFEGYRPRPNGWTDRRTRIFLRALGETGSVRDACMRARITDNSAYRMRRRFPKFAAAWEKALDETIPTLEQAAWERAVEGWEEVVWKDGVEVSRKRRFSDGLLRYLIERAAGGRPGRKASEKELIAFAREAAHAAGGYFETRATSEETDAAIMKKLDMIDKARALEAADRAAAEAAEAAAAAGDGAGAAGAAGEDAGRAAGGVPPVARRVSPLPRITGCP